MSRLTSCAALLLTACSSTNPLFGVDPSDGSGETSAAATTTTAATTTAPPTSQGPTTDPTTAPTASEATTTASPSEPITSGTTLPDTTGGDIDTSDIDTSDLDTGSTSTGEMSCELHKDPDFNDLLNVGGQPLAECINPVTYFHGRVQAGAGELRFNTTGTGCASEENDGVLSLGSGYSISVPNEGECAKLYLFRDGDGPECDIAQFFIIEANTQQAVAIGAFTPDAPAPNPPVSLLLPEPELLPCCPAASQDCCDETMYGDYILHVDGTPVYPGATEDVIANGQPARLINIQHWEAIECIDKEPDGRRDFVGIRL